MVKCRKWKVALSVLLLSTVPVAFLSGCTGQQTTVLQSTVRPTVEGIESIQAYTDLSFYGQQLTKVEITYKNNVDLSGISAAAYHLLDRGYATPDFGPVPIESVDVTGKVVTLNISNNTGAQPSNVLIYSGDNATGSRSVNRYGVYVTGPWYRDVKGVIHADNVGYAAREVGEGGMGEGEGYQARPSLELKLYHTGESFSSAVCLAKDDGSYNAGGPWQPTIDANHGDSGFKTFEELDIQVPTTATDGDKWVKGWAYFPENFHKNGSKKYPLVVSLNGYGVAYWKLTDGTNNFGTGLSFDGSSIRWIGCGAIVLNIHDRSHTGGAEYKFYEDDYNVIQYFFENYNADPDHVILTGNSRGTIAANTVASTYPGLVNTLIIMNGSMGNGIAGIDFINGLWEDEHWRAAAESGISMWVIDGEQDSENFGQMETAISYYKAAGWSNEWIADNLRLTGLPTELFFYWGETDHSVTKLAYWYFFDEPFYGPDCTVIGGELVYNNRLNPGDTYQLKGKLVNGAYNKEGKDYVIYSETLKDWALSRD